MLIGTLGHCVFSSSILSLDEAQMEAVHMDSYHQRMIPAIYPSVDEFVSLTTLSVEHPLRSAVLHVEFEPSYTYYGNTCNIKMSELKGLWMSALFDRMVFFEDIW